MRPVDPVIFLITGPMAAGKSTVGCLLARRFERGVHLDGDLFRRSIARGRSEMTPSPSPEAVEQLRLRHRIAAAAADMYAEAGFTVALEDVAAGPLLGEYRTMIRHRPCHVVVLAPSLDAIAARNAERGDGADAEWPIGESYAGFLNTTPRVGLWLDSSDISPEETVDQILAHTASERDRIVISDPDPDWPALFERIASSVRPAVADLPATVEHIGSTSVPGLAAKPVIDVDVVVREADDVAVAIERLRALGYVYQGDKGIPGREAFLWPPGAPRHHLYVVVSGSTPHADHIRFRDLLRRRPDLAHEYALLKRALADSYEKDRVGYTNAKDEFIAEALAQARHVRAGDDTG
ncbi:MAG TPA: GrpB family protein [Gaiellales bacterium]